MSAKSAKILFVLLPGTAYHIAGMACLMPFAVDELEFNFDWKRGDGKVLPMLKRWNVGVVDFVPSAHDNDPCYL